MKTGTIVGLIAVIGMAVYIVADIYKNGTLSSAAHDSLGLRT